MILASRPGRPPVGSRASAARLWPHEAQHGVDCEAEPSARGHLRGVGQAGDLYRAGGVGCGAVPSWPEPLEPQASAVPFDFSASTWKSPAES